MRKVSIIIPVYNTEKYLEECLESILKQTMEDIEIICLDDGSTDSSLEILNKYKNKDSRITIIHKENSGYGATVNLGIEHASGEYVSIVEPDDYIKENMLQALYTCAKENNLDMVTSDHLQFCDDDGTRLFQIVKIINDSSVYRKRINPQKNRRVFWGNYTNPASLFKRSFLLENNIRHNESPGASYQDVGFGFQVLLFAESIMLLDDVYYCYRRDNPLSSIASGEKLGCIIEEYNFIYNIMKERVNQYEGFMPEFCRRQFKDYYYTLDRISTEFKHQYICMISDELKRFYHDKKLNLENFSLKWRLDISEIMEYPEKFYESYMSDGYKLHEMVKEFDSIIIYGAGGVGRKIYNSLFDEDKAKVKGFAVTHLNENEYFYRGVMIREIEMFEVVRDAIAVIVGVSEKYQEEIFNNLKMHNFQHILMIS